MELKHREFLRLSAAVGVATPCSGCAQTNEKLSSLSQNSSIKSAQGEWRASTCQGCTTWCPVEIFVQEGGAVKVKGNHHSR